MSLRRSETTEAILYVIDYTMIATLPLVVRNDKKSITTQSPGEGENYFSLPVIFGIYLELKKITSPLFGDIETAYWVRKDNNEGKKGKRHPSSL